VRVGSNQQENMKESVKNARKKIGRDGRKGTQTKDFKKGREYEQARHRMIEALWLGYCSLIFSPIFLFGSVWNTTARIFGSVILIGFGAINLYIGYSFKKDMEKYEK